nr:PREDICTED: uncharacterized protein LOC103313928 [Tribolium castaneum]|eukprot:XP_008196683.1 PREDICTED: uncharacterized protein LOC103313928 [Tribolium castaneum]
MSSSEDELFDIDWGASNVFDCFDYVDPYVLSPQIQAVLENDIVGLRRLLQEGKSVNINDNKGNTPLHHAVQSQGNLTSIFNCLIELEDIRLDAANFNGETPLMLALKNAYYVRKLLQKGADPNLRYPNGDSLLHKATDVGVVRLLLEHGADINAQNFNGETPLFHACQQKEIELVHLYLYHGADVSISDNCGLLAFDICPESVDSLFYLTFDEHTEVSLLSLFKAIEKKSPYLTEIVKLTRNVTYTRKQLNEFVAQISLPWCEVFFNLVDSFINREFANSMQVFRLMSARTHTCDVVTIEDFLYIFLYFYVRDNSLCPLLRNIHLRGQLLIQFAMKFVCYCASQGTEVTSEVLDVVYHEFGFCEFYRTLLNIAKIRNHCCKFDSYAGRNFMAFFTYDLNLSIDMVERFPKENLEAQCFAKLLKFFNVIKYKDKFPHLFEMFSRKLGVSAVPSLVELSRNAARKFIISKLKVEDNVQFLTVVNHLPVPNVVKQIIIYQKEIYNI